MEYLEALMGHLGVQYYVGWLSAAAIHGSAHHAVQVTQVASSRPVAARHFGRGRIQFYIRSNVGAIPTVPHRTDTGDVPVSTPEATCLDLACDPLIAGGVSNAATVIAGLAEESLDSTGIAALAGLFPQAALRRVGHILDHYCGCNDLGGLRGMVRHDNEPSLLAPGGRRAGHIDPVWNLVVNTKVEVET
jgi:predicted transcriptional regulator of viral defense system